MNEAQARALATLAEAEVAPVWQATHDNTAGKPTAGAARDAAASYRPSAADGHRKRRAPITDEYGALAIKCSGVAAKLNKLHRDDRFTANRAMIARSWLSDIDRLITEFTALRTDLAGELGPTLPGLQDEHPVPVENMVPTADAVVEIRGNSAVVLVGRGRVAEEVKALGIITMPDVKTRKLSFPADRIDDVAAAIEARGWTIDVRMAASW